MAVDTSDPRGTASLHTCGFCDYSSLRRDCIQRHCDLKRYKHVDSNLGPDAHIFNAEIFAHGIVNACKIPQVYMLFVVGSRVCIGQLFAMTELEVILCLILSEFSFSLSSIPTLNFI